MALITFSLIFAGFSGFGLAQVIPNSSSSEENLSDNSIADSSVEKIAAKSDVDVESKGELSHVNVDDSDVKEDVISTGGDDTYDDDVISTGGDDT